MMVKTLLLTTRVAVCDSYREVRDCIDQQLVKLLADLQFDVFLMPNCLSDPVRWITKVSPNGIILSGGNDIHPKHYQQENLSCNNISVERDAAEMAVINYAVKHKVPLLGICRGLQMINVAFGGSLVQDLTAREGKKISHVSSVHTLEINGHFFLEEYVNSRIVVNSFHNQGITDQCMAKSLVSVAYSEDGVIEALRHKKYDIFGVQWHPERKDGDVSFDKKLITQFFNTV